MSHKINLELPALEYCSLERATRLIGHGCEVEDLLHWAEMGSIKLSAKLSFGDVTDAGLIFCSDSKESLESKLNSIDKFNVRSFSLTRHSYFNLGDSASNLLVSNDDNIYSIDNALIYGVWDIGYVIEVIEDGLIIKDLHPNGMAQDIDNECLHYDKMIYSIF